MDPGAFYDDYWRRQEAKPCRRRHGGRFSAARSSAVDPDADRRREADADALIFLQLKAESFALEIGIGRGANTSRMAAIGARVVAVDLSFEALRQARADLHFRNKGWIGFVQADAHRLPFRARLFDRAAIFSVMMFLDPVHFPPELRRVTSLGARIAIVEPLAGNPFLSAWRFAVRTYHGAAAWRDAATLIESIRRHFRIVETRGYHLCPAVALLRDGALRRALLSIEARLLASSPALMARAWIMRIGAIQEGSSR